MPSQCSLFIFNGHCNSIVIVLQQNLNLNYFLLLQEKFNSCFGPPGFQEYDSIDVFNKCLLDYEDAIFCGYTIVGSNPARTYNLKYPDRAPLDLKIGYEYALLNCECWKDPEEQSKAKAKRQEKAVNKAIKEKKNMPGTRERTR
jgi:hypothetical protein